MSAWHSTAGHSCIQAQCSHLKLYAQVPLLMLLLRDSISVIPPLVLCSKAAESFIGRSRLLQRVSVLSFALRRASCCFCSVHQWRFSVCSSAAAPCRAELSWGFPPHVGLEIHRAASALLTVRGVEMFILCVACGLPVSGVVGEGGVLPFAWPPPPKAAAGNQGGRKGWGSQTRLGCLCFTLQIRKFGGLVSCKPCPRAPALTSGHGFFPVLLIVLLQDVPTLVQAGEENQVQAEMPWVQEAHVHG